MKFYWVGCREGFREAGVARLLPEFDGNYLSIYCLICSFGVLHPGLHAFKVLAGVHVTAWREAQGGQVDLEIVVGVEGNGLLFGDYLEFNFGRVTALDSSNDTQRLVLRPIGRLGRMLRFLHDVYRRLCKQGQGREVA